MRQLEVFNPRWLEWEPASSAQFLGIGSLIGGAVSGLGSLAGGIFGSSSATDAARVQADAARQAAQLQFQMFQQIQGNMRPFIDTGVSELNNLTGILPDLINPTSYGLPPGQFFAANTPYGTSTPGGYGGQAFTPQTPYGGTTFQPTVPLQFDPTMDTLRQTPGYQFALDQGMRAVTNQNAALGLGSSGALGRGLVNYAEGLASTTYQNQFNNWLQTLQTQGNIYSNLLGQQYGMFSGNVGQQYGIWQGQNANALSRSQQTYNMLGGLAGSGQNAAANLGSTGLSAATTAGNLLTSGAAATAGGIVGSNNALFGGVQGAAGGVNNSLMNYALINALGGGNMGGNNALNQIFGGQAAVGAGPSASGTGGLY